MERIIHAKTLYLGPDELLIAAKIGIVGAGTAEDMAAVIDEAERRIRASLTTSATIYLEPDVYDADYTPQGRDTSDDH